MSLLSKIARALQYPKIRDAESPVTSSVGCDLCDSLVALEMQGQVKSQLQLRLLTLIS